MTVDSNYHSPLREQAKHATRARILEALVRVILDDGVHAFSVANVAKRAGVSHRTVYRHFATREELLEGLGDWLDSGQDFGSAPGLPESLRDLPAHAITMFQGLARVRDAAEAEFIAAVAMRHSMSGKSRRWSTLQAMVAETYPALSADDQLAAATVFRALLSSSAWFHVCVQLGVEEGTAARGLSRAAELVLEDLERRNAAAAHRHTRNADARVP